LCSFSVDLVSAYESSSAREEMLAFSRGGRQRSACSDGRVNMRPVSTLLGKRSPNYCRTLLGPLDVVAFWL
jgi:hypothetical protein